MVDYTLSPLWLRMDGKRNVQRQATFLIMRRTRWGLQFTGSHDLQTWQIGYVESEKIIDHCTVSVAILDVGQSRKKLQQMYGILFNFQRQ